MNATRRAAAEAPDQARAALATWWAARGWQPFPFQEEVWQALQAGESGLLHATTGAGKTYAVWLGALMALAGSRGSGGHAPPLTVLWITPMRALAADTQRALETPLLALREQAAAADANPAATALGRWTLGLRTGDSSSAERSAQNKRLPIALVTTPESLSLMLARSDAAEVLGAVRLVVVDEWHELLGSKRGVQVQLALARLAEFGRLQQRPGPMVWGLSATLGNLDEALQTLVGPGQGGRLVRAQIPKALSIDTLLPPQAERFAWAGHLGLRMLPQVADAIASSASTLVFTNTRSQAELWYQALLDARPEWAGEIALHHGSLARETREWVEAGLKAGQLRAVVCTSSLDLGVDFLPVERVLQIGSPKGVARLLQRAGRSGHAPGRPSRITLVPTHSLELVEGAAARAAVAAGHIESRRSPRQPLDVLVQHLVTVALGGGFEPDALYAEVTRTAAYAQLSSEAWQWCLDFVQRGGPSLAAYPEYRRAVPMEDGRWHVPDAATAKRHRLNIGTIVSDASMAVEYMGGGKLGTVEESFVARMRPGDRFLFAGRLLELVRIHQMTAYVKRATAGRASVPRWNGGRMPLSTTLADAMVAQLAEAAEGRFESPELQCARPLLALQQEWSHLPTPQTLLAEVLKTREGWHLFLYPFAGRQVHLGLANLLAWRAAQLTPATFSMAFNDYGFELLSATPRDWAAELPTLLAGGGDLLAEVLASLNAGELAQRRFREIARVAGLITQGYPGERRSNRQLQASSALFYDVFRQYDPQNPLLRQAEQELLAEELDIDRLQAALDRMRARTLDLQHPRKATPLAFPLMVERFRERLSNEPLAERIARMVQQLEAAAGPAEGDVVPEAAAVAEGLAFGHERDVGRERRNAPEPQAEAGRGRRRTRKPSRPLPLL